MLLRHGLPIDCSHRFVEPDMCLPILPSTNHPTSREALRPSRPLPWNDCYLETVQAVNVRVRAEYQRDDAVTRLEGSDNIQNVLRHAFNDKARYREMRAATTVLKNGEAPKDPALNGGRPGFADGNTDLEENLRREPTILLLKASYDLESVRELADPQYFYEEKAQLDQ